MVGLGSRLMIAFVAETLQQVRRGDSRQFVMRRCPEVVKRVANLGRLSQA